MIEPENTSNELGLMTFQEGAKLLSIGVVTFTKLVDEGKIPAIQKTDKLRVVRKQDVVNYINNQVPTVETKTETTELSKVEEQILLTKKNQELEALKAGFKNSDEFKQEFDNLKEDRDILEQKKAQYELDMKVLDAERKAFAILKLKGESDIAQGKSDNISILERLKTKEEEYKKKWKAEDDKRQNENKLTLVHIDELSKTVYNMHPQYLGKLAKEKLAKDLEPVLTYYGIPPMFNKKGEYLSLSSRLSLMDSGDVVNDRIDATGVPNEIEMSTNIQNAYGVLLSFYKWVVGAQGGYEFSNWLYKELKTLDGLITDKTPEAIERSINTIMEHFGAINRGMVELAGKFDKSNHPNQVSNHAETEYILKVTDSIEHLLGIADIEGE